MLRTGRKSEYDSLSDRGAPHSNIALHFYESHEHEQVHAPAWFMTHGSHFHSVSTMWRQTPFHVFPPFLCAPRCYQTLQSFWLPGQLPPQLQLLLLVVEAAAAASWRRWLACRGWMVGRWAC